MSTGPRIPVAVALGIARALAPRWGMARKDQTDPRCIIVGSLRRRGHDESATVGDIEILAPMPGPMPERPIATKEEQDAWRKTHADEDSVYTAIRDSIAPTPPPAQAEMFAPPPPPAAPPIGRAIKGLSPCFMALSAEVYPAALGIADAPGVVAVQVFRYWPGPHGNLGWSQLMRTGPTELGEWFLSRWKDRYSIPWQQQASAFGYLRDRYGVAVPIETEGETLERIGVKYIEPAQREQWIAAKVAAMNGGRR